MVGSEAISRARRDRFGYRPNMMNQTTSAAAAGTCTLGGDTVVNRLGFGAMRITGAGIWGPPADRNGALSLLRRTIELGINVIDTADSYGPNVSEELIAEALYPYPADLIVATKGGHTRSGPDQWTPNGDPTHLRQAVEDSLKRLRLERIDLYQLHRPDPKVPFEESVLAIAEMQRAGKIRHVGLSNVSVEQIERARKITTIVSVQNRFNNATGGSAVFNGVTDDETLAVVEYCTQNSIAFFPWGPLAAGKLSSERISAVAKEHAAEPNQVALAWLLRRSPVIIPIPGTASIAHLEQNVAAAELHLSDSEFQALSVAG